MASAQAYVVVGIRAGELLMRRGRAILRVCDPRMLEPPKKRSWDEIESELSYPQHLFVNKYEPIDLAFEIPVAYSVLRDLDIKIGDRVTFHVAKMAESKPSGYSA